MKQPTERGKVPDSSLPVSNGWKRESIWFETDGDAIWGNDAVAGFQSMYVNGEQVILMPRHYNTLRELKAAYETGEIPEGTKLIMDTDDCAVYVDGVKVFQGFNPFELAYEALSMLGIPASAA